MGIDIPMFIMAGGSNSIVWNVRKFSGDRKNNTIFYAVRYCSFKGLSKVVTFQQLKIFFKLMHQRVFRLLIQQ